MQSARMGSIGPLAWVVETRHWRDSRRVRVRLVLRLRDYRVATSVIVTTLKLS